MKTVLAKLLTLSLVLIFSGCSNSPEDEAEPRTDVFSFIDFGLTLQDTLLGSYKSDLNLTSVLLEDSYKVMESVEEMGESVATSRELSAEFINLLAKGQTFNSGYSDIFSLNSSYGADTSYFSIDNVSNDTNYLLVSSSTRLFVQGTTIKTLFNDESSLDAAWQRSLDNHQSGNMYLNIYEVKIDGTVERAGTPALIPADTVTTLQSTI